MTFEGFLIYILIGGIAGWAAGMFRQGKGYGILANILIGIAGGVVGGWIFGLFGLEYHGILGSILTATVGAILLLFVIAKIRG